MLVQGETYMEGYCYKPLFRVDRLIGREVCLVLERCNCKKVFQQSEDALSKLRRFTVALGSFFYPI